MLNIIKTIISDFHERTLPGKNIPRMLDVPLNSGKIITVFGPRRTGKTYYLYSLISKLRKKINPHNIIYINFEDERLDIDKSHLQLIPDAYQQLYPETNLSEVYFFFDEIQEVDGWEKFTRRLHETISKNIFITGSSAKLMGKEIASSLRGRALPFLLLPFSFEEYLTYNNITIDNTSSSKNRNKIISHFDRFIQRGGFPEVFDFDEVLYLKTIQSYVDIMLFRDIIERHNIKNIHVVKDMLKRIISNNAMIFSVNKYYNDLRSRGIHISKDRLYEIMDHLEDAYLVLPVKKYNESVIKQQKALKKIYVNDTGIATALNFTSSLNIGRLLEAIIFLEMKKKNMHIYYYTNGFETDFVIQSRQKIQSAIQVCYNLTKKNKEREIRGLISSMDHLEVNTGYILTHSVEEDLKINNVLIKVVPAWKWILSLE